MPARRARSLATSALPETVEVRPPPEISKNPGPASCSQKLGVTKGVGRALQAIAEAALEHGLTYLFEFPPANLATDDEGNLILLDVVFRDPSEEGA